MRAHVLALGGNALISYFMSELVIMHNPHKNQVSLMDFLCLLTLKIFFFLITVFVSNQHV